MKIKLHEVEKVFLDRRGNYVFYYDLRELNILFYTLQRSMCILWVCQLLNMHYINIQFRKCITSKPTVNMNKIANSSLRPHGAPAKVAVHFANALVQAKVERPAADAHYAKFGIAEFSVRIVIMDSLTDENRSNRSGSILSVHRKPIG
jgi:hypothetical protein